MLELTVLPSLKLSVTTESGVRELTLAFPIPSVIEAEEKTGRDLKSLKGWFDLESKDLPAVIAAGLKKFHPDLPADEFQTIVENLSPEALDQVHYALCQLAFPKTMAEIEKRRNETLSPNAPSADAR